MRLDGHYFLGADTGVFRLLSDKQPEGVFDFSGLNLDVSAPTFPEREVFVRPRLTWRVEERRTSSVAPRVDSKKPSRAA